MAGDLQNRLDALESEMGLLKTKRSFCLGRLSWHEIRRFLQQIASGTEIYFQVEAAADWWLALILNEAGLCRSFSRDESEHVEVDDGSYGAVRLTWDGIELLNLMSNEAVLTEVLALWPLMPPLYDLRAALQKRQFAVT